LQELQPDSCTKMNDYVFINGCFDVLHAGHCRFINFAVELKKMYNAELVVAIDSEEKVRKDKGYPRPYFSEQERIMMLCEYCPEIDRTHVFDTNQDLAQLIKDYNPILIKGERWHGKVVGQNFAKRIYYVPDYRLPSTSMIEDRLGS